MFENWFWEVIREPRGGYSKLRSKYRESTGFAWWRCRLKELKGDLDEPSEGRKCPEYC